MKYPLAALLAICLFSKTTAQNTTGQLGTTYHFQLKNPVPADGAKAGAENSVLVFVPKGLPFLAKTDMIVHFQGEMAHADSSEKTTNLIKQFSDAKRPAIFVLPNVAKNAAENFGGQLGAPSAFRNFIVEMLDSLAKTGRVTAPGNIITSCFGGGHRVMAHILVQGGMENEIKEAWVFDGLFGELDKFEQFAKPAGRRLLNFYTPTGGAKEKSLEFDLIIHERGTSFYVFIDEGKMQKAWPWLPAGRVFQVAVPLAHDEMMQKTSLFMKVVNATPILK